MHQFLLTFERFRGSIKHPHPPLPAFFVTLPTCLAVHGASLQCAEVECFQAEKRTVEKPRGAQRDINRITNPGVIVGVRAASGCCEVERNERGVGKAWACFTYLEAAVPGITS